MTRKKEKDKRIFKLGRKLGLSIFVFCVVLTVGICIYGLIQYENTVVEITAARGYVLNDIVSESIDGDKVSEYAKTWKKDKSYREMKEFLEETVKSCGLDSIDIVVPYDDTHVRYIYDSSEEMFGKKEKIENPKLFYRIFNSKKSGEHASTDYTIKVGNFSVKACRITDSSGNPVAIVFVDQEEQNIYDRLVGYIFSIVLVIIALVILFHMGFRKRIGKLLLDPLQKIIGETEMFVKNNVEYSGELETIRTRDELQELAENVIRMEKDTIEYIERTKRVTAEKERISAEMDFASEIQAKMLPDTFPPFPERDDVDIFATMTPARSVGGDFFDFFFIDRDRLAVVIGDASGEGVPAALFMAVAKTLIRTCARSEHLDFKEIINLTNRMICRDNSREMFVTVWFCVMDLKAGEAYVVNAGHENPALKRKDGSFEMIKYRHSVVVGAFEDSEYVPRKFKLIPGDRIFVYTDGLTEACGQEGNSYGENRLIEALRKNEDDDIRRVLKGVEDDVGRFTEGAERTDDITMMCIDYFGPDGRESLCDKENKKVQYENEIRN